MDSLDIGTKIKALRKEKNLTQKELGERIHVTDKAISKWERGNGLPDMATLPLLAQALDVSPSVFFEQREVPEERRAEEALGTTLEYAQKVERMKNETMRKIALYTVSAANLIGIVTCFIVGVSLGQTNTWLPISIASMVLGWLLAMACIVPRKSAPLWGLGALTLLVIPYLWIVSLAVPVKGWFVPVALPISIASIVIMWIGCFLFYTKLARSTVVSIQILFVPVMDWFVDCVLANGVPNYFDDIWRIFTFIISFIAAAAVFFIGRWRRKATVAG